MTTIDSTSSAAATAASAQTSASADATSSTTLSSDFATFLKMLTTQLQNQDPLNPMDSTEFAVQLATFSNVEQQVKTNDLLSQMIQTSSTSQMAELANWIGSEVRVEAPATFQGDPITISPAPADAASWAELVVTDRNGVEKNRFEIPVSDDPIEWAGVDSQENTVAWGEYTLSVVSYDSDGNLIDSRTPEIYSRVTEARLAGNAAELVLSGGTVVSADSVTAIRKAD
ncbi:flagellar hook capping FlgD N-terminal domain-containing protein [Tropicimonas sp. IMCC34043]|uniref:flagellar hook capping FlgD N-terminal domain-containing protein n=1 Tax=Tropicimonas sp. IMCC34043 TaxID=2248760 RepID=UPI000E27816D|nr:flagellar hook capping FlgD N-terminal domain-containing protein [Tropicimonas sp. IMCC34043]